MWIRKSEQEIRTVLAARDLRRKAVWRPLSLATGVTAVAVLLYSFGLRACSQGVVIVSSARTEFGLRTVLVGASLFVFLFCLSMYNQRRGRGLFEDDALLCRKCKQPCHTNQDLRCACGGRLEPLDYFDWASDAEITDAAEPEKAEYL